MAYASPDDLDLAIGPDERTRGADRNADGVEDPGVYQHHFDDASGEIDMYLAKVVKLPLKKPYPLALRRLCVNMAVYHAAPEIGGRTKEKRKRYDDAIAQLEKIAAGDLGIGLGPDGEDPGFTGKQAFHGSAAREFTAESMGSGGLF
jgi:phage gp36-like protein